MRIVGVGSITWFGWSYGIVMAVIGIAEIVFSLLRD
jgi:hypothetical protein